MNSTLPNSISPNSISPNSISLNSTSLIRQFSAYQQKVLRLCEQYPDDLNSQFHPDLSPLGWHLGHCVYTETYWVKEQLLCDPSPDQELQSHYVPELVKKSDRGKTLPDHFELCKWASESQHENLELLIKYQDRHYQNRKHQNSNKHELMRHQFLVHFLIQHYAQHFETMHMILVQRALKNTVNFFVQQPLASSDINTSTIVLNAGDYTVGAQTDFLPYDNEYPPHEFRTGDIQFSDKPVSNSEFLLFMEESGYQTQEYWGQQGWQWKEKYNISCPEYWLQDSQQNWFGVDIEGPHELDPEFPVWGLNYFEALAVANWAGGRLPHESEWEAAKQHDFLKNTGQVWEWCQNSFHPYQGSTQGFRAFPYDGYSIPYFDGSHFVMKGASRYTQEVIQRSSFRNYYQADKRYQFAGCRLVFE